MLQSCAAVHQGTPNGHAPFLTKRANPDFLNGVPELLILSVLSRRPRYGYERIQAIRRATNGTLELGEGSVYRPWYTCS